MKIVSACLAGIRCNYAGRAAARADVMDWVRRGEALPACPEQLGGLTTPRTPVELRAGLAFTRDGADVTEAFERGAREVLRMCDMYGCREAVLKAHSPSCGCGMVYDGSFSGTLVPGDGITARILRENGIAVRSVDDDA